MEEMRLLVTKQQARPLGPVGSRSAPPTVQGHSLMAKAADGRRRRSATAAAVTLCLTVDSSQCAQG